MARLSRRSRHTLDIWPGFVDALSNLVMIITFLLLIFVLSQFYLSETLSGRDAALEQLNREVSELANLLSLEKAANTDLQSTVSQLSAELQSTLAERDKLGSELNSLRTVRDSLTSRLAELQDKAESADAESARLAAALSNSEAAIAQRDADLARLMIEIEAANKTIAADRETVEVQLKELAELRQDVAAMTAYRAELEKQLQEMLLKTKSSEDDLVREREISAAAKAQLALLNRQLAELREQIGALNEALEASEARDQEQKAQIVDLGQRLNAALASKVQELARYRSEFFGRLRDVLGERQDIRIVGDRFVFQSEVLFASGEAELGAPGKEQLAALARTLIDIAARIPPDINWVLQVDGHTDRVPIHNEEFPSNWELSTARALSVLRFLQAQGIAPEHLAATGYAEYQPLEPGDSAEAYSRNRRIELKLTQR